MRWVRTDGERKSSAEWFRIPKAQRCDHHQLEVYCWRVENGGRIAGATSFKNGDWYAAAGTTRQGIARLVDSGLVQWDGTDLVVVGYDAHGQQMSQNFRELQRMRRQIRAQKHHENLANLVQKPTQKRLSFSDTVTSDSKVLGSTMVATMVPAMVQPNGAERSGDPDPDPDPPPPPPPLPTVINSARDGGRGGGGGPGGLLTEAIAGVDAALEGYPRQDRRWKGLARAEVERLLGEAAARAETQGREASVGWRALARAIAARIEREKRSRAWTRDDGGWIPQMHKWLGSLDGGALVKGQRVT